jgi:DNA mismatch repair protein PMS2
MLDVRFKNHGLDSIEVQDNGTGISKENYDSLGTLSPNCKIEM